MNVSRSAFVSSIFLSRLADQMLFFLVPLVVFATTHEATWSGIAFFVEALPRFLAFPLCGVLCDRMSPVRLLRISQASRAITCLVGVAGYLVWGGLPWLVGLSAVCGALTSQGFVAREVLLPQVFAGQRFEKVLSYTQLADQLGMVLGPLAATALMGWRNWEWAVGGAALLFMASDGLVEVWQRTTSARIRPPAHTTGPLYAPLCTAIAQVLTLPGLVRLVLLAAAENLVIGTTLATSAAMVTGTFGQTSEFYAALQVAGAIATVLILLLVAHVKISRVRLGTVAFIAIAAGGLAMGMSTSIATYTIAFLVVIGFDKMFNVYIRSSRQAIIPPQDYGKTTGVIVLLNNATQPLAGLLVGLAAGKSSISLVVTLTAAGMITLGGVVTVISVARARLHASRCY